MKKMIVLFFFIIILSGCSPKATIELEEGMDTVEVFSIYQIRGCTVIIGENEYRMNVVDNPVDTEIVGEYVIDYKKEVNGKTYHCQRVVFVIDQTSPELTLLPGIDTITIGESWVDGGISIMDNYDQDLDVIIISNNLDENMIGTYQVIYSVTDLSGNTSVITRNIHVIEGE